MRQCDECEYYRGGESCGHPSIKTIILCGVGDTFPWIHETPPWCPIDKDEQTERE